MINKNTLDSHGGVVCTCMVVTKRPKQVGVSRMLALMEQPNLMTSQPGLKHGIDGEVSFEYFDGYIILGTMQYPSVDCSSTACLSLSSRSTCCSHPFLLC